MISGELGRQLMIAVENDVGALADVTGTMSAAGINLIALCAYSLEKRVAIMFVTSDNNAAKSLLENKGYNLQEEEVVLLTIDNKPGALQSVIDHIAEAEIDLKLIYGSCPSEADISRIVMISEHNLDVMMVIKMLCERT